MRDEINDIATEFWTYARFAISSLIDAGFLVAWYWVQVWASKWINGGPLDWIDNSVFFIFRIVLAITTLVPVIRFMVIDTYRTYKQGMKKLREIRIETELDVSQ